MNQKIRKIKIESTTVYVLLFMSIFYVCFFFCLMGFSVYAAKRNNVPFVVGIMKNSHFKKNEPFV